jgi:hypothetical protein
MTLQARRRVRPPALPAPSVVDVLLGGWAGPVEGAADADFTVFELSEAELIATWRQHRDALLAEAERRGIARPWAIEQGFDG